MRFQVERRCSSSFLLFVSFSFFFRIYCILFLRLFVRWLRRSFVLFTIFSFFRCCCCSLCFVLMVWILSNIFISRWIYLEFYFIVLLVCCCCYSPSLLRFLFLSRSLDSLDLDSVSLGSVKCLTSTQAAFWRPLIVQNYVNFVLNNRNTHRQLGVWNVCAFCPLREYGNTRIFTHIYTTHKYLFRCTDQPYSHARCLTCTFANLTLTLTLAINVGGGGGGGNDGRPLTILAHNYYDQ